MSHGTETCSCVIRHVPSILRKPTVTRTQVSVCLACGPRAPDAIQAVTERHLLTRRDAQVACLILNGTLHRGEPCLEILSIGVYSLDIAVGGGCRTSGCRARSTTSGC